MAFSRTRSTKKSSPIAAPVTITPPPSIPTPSVPIPQRSNLQGSGATASPSIPAPRIITREQIERRAYDLYASRGYTPGDPVADWYEAERQLKAGL
ncbi:MAG: DUF2934 domain-containing protein [Phycisphaerales bacterium]|nr:DUF2934 domain-containing protein [Phycisphaerales bacterium]